MGSLVFKNILERKIDIFANTFGDDSSSLFKRDNKIIHPLEYGMYRERCFKELLRLTTNKNTDIADGFIITASEKISTQCDIIIYQSSTIPLIDNGIANFYPIEVVNGIGEIKSDLSKSDFQDSLIKLAKNKMLVAERKGTIIGEKQLSGEDDCILSFLVCNKLSFKFDRIDFDEIYEGILPTYRHNLILSLQDGLFTYKLRFKGLNQSMKDRFVELGGIVNSNDVIWEHPVHIEGDEVYKCPDYYVGVNTSDKYSHITYFLTIVQAVLKHQYQYNFDFTEYLDLNCDNIFTK